MAGSFESKRAVIVGLMLLMISMCKAANATEAQVGDYNVKSYGASGDGKTDDTKAFQDAWCAACAAGGTPKLTIPEGDFLVGPLVFKGPCSGSSITVEIKGQLLASVDLNIYDKDWVHFQYVSGLQIYGGGILNGQGASAWPQNKCENNKRCRTLPNSLVFSYVENSRIDGISSVDSKFFHINVYQSKDVEFNNIKVSAPGDSPNTDGIHMGDSTGITIKNTIIGTGDDCISIGPGSTNVTISSVYCGPGHGISVGSLGKASGENDVMHLTVTNCTLSDTTNGVRIKTWQSTPSPLKASGFIFDNIIMKDVQNPIIIDQEYCPFDFTCAGSGLKPSAVKIEDVKFTNIRGSSASEEAIKFLCSSTNPCEGVELGNINLEYTGVKSDVVLNSTCVNVHGKCIGNVFPTSCL